MPSMHSEPDAPLARRPWVLAVLLAFTVFCTLQALAIGAPVPMLAASLVAGGLCLAGLKRLEAWRYLPHLRVILFSAALGHLGLLVGVTQDLGTAGLMILASLCSMRVDYGLDDALAMWRTAPWAHLGMLLGCNLGMLVGGCSELPAMRHGMSKGRFLLLCNLGMLIGMFVVQLWQPGIPGGGIESTALWMTLQMLGGMALGMIGAWWFAERLYIPRPTASVVVTGNRG